MQIDFGINSIFLKNFFKIKPKIIKFNLGKEVSNAETM